MTSVLGHSQKQSSSPISSKGEVIGGKVSNNNKRKSANNIQDDSIDDVVMPLASDFERPVRGGHKNNIFSKAYSDRRLLSSKQSGLNYHSKIGKD